MCEWLFFSSSIFDCSFVRSYFALIAVVGAAIFVRFFPHHLSFLFSFVVLLMFDVVVVSWLCFPILYHTVFSFSLEFVFYCRRLCYLFFSYIIHIDDTINCVYVQQLMLFDFPFNFNLC